MTTTINQTEMGKTGRKIRLEGASMYLDSARNWASDTRRYLKDGDIQTALRRLNLVIERIKWAQTELEEVRRKSP